MNKVDFVKAARIGHALVSISLFHFFQCVGYELMMNILKNKKEFETVESEEQEKQRKIVSDFFQKLKVFKGKAEKEKEVVDDSENDDENDEEDDFFYNESFFDSFDNSEKKFDLKSKRQIFRLASLYNETAGKDESDEKLFPPCSAEDDERFELLFT